MRHLSELREIVEDNPFSKLYERPYYDYIKSYKVYIEALKYYGSALNVPEAAMVAYWHGFDVIVLNRLMQGRYSTRDVSLGKIMINLNAKWLIALAEYVEWRYKLPKGYLKRIKEIQKDMIDIFGEINYDIRPLFTDSVLLSVSKMDRDFGVIYFIKIRLNPSVASSQPFATAKYIMYGLRLLKSFNSFINGNPSREDVIRVSACELAAADWIKCCAAPLGYEEGTVFYKVAEDLRREIFSLIKIKPDLKPTYKTCRTCEVKCDVCRKTK